MHLGINNILASLVFLLGGNQLVAQPKIIISGPSQARIGMGTNATVRIINDAIHGPARVSLTIPKGWELEKFPGELASVNQVGNQIKIIWLEFPIRDTVDVVFLMRIPENAEKGMHTIVGDFDYLKDGNAKKIAIPAHSYKIFKYYTRVQ